MVEIGKDCGFSKRLIGHRLPLLMDLVSSCSRLKVGHSCEKQGGLSRRYPTCLLEVDERSGDAGGGGSGGPCPPPPGLHTYTKSKNLSL